MIFGPGHTSLTVGFEVIQYEDCHIKGEYTWAPKFEGQTASVEPLVTPDTSSRPAHVSAGNAHPLYYRSENFPALPTPNEPGTPRARTEQETGVWSDHKESITHRSSNTNGYHAVPPPASYDSLPDYAYKNFVRKPAVNSKIQTMQTHVNPAEDGPHCITSSVLVVDPDHPDYNPAVFHNAILKRYVCPYKICR